MNRRKLVRLLFLMVCAALLGYSLALERHVVWSFSHEQPSALSGAKFVEGSTTDDYLRNDERVYDVRTLMPGTAGIKDCKT
jgi:hypothetical protein